MICKAKHTILQPTEEQQACPDCGASNDRFYIQEGADNANEECPNLHLKDFLYCQKCDKGLTGESFAKKLRLKLKLIRCPTCRGKGVVQKRDKTS